MIFCNTVHNINFESCLTVHEMHLHLRTYCIIKLILKQTIVCFMYKYDFKKFM